MKNLFYIIVLTTTVFVTACLPGDKESGSELLILGDYFGQTPPGDSATLFAPGIISTMPADSVTEGNEDIWVCTKTDGKWSEPNNLGAPVNTSSKEFFPSVTIDGTIYYTHLDTIAHEEFIYRSKMVNSAYQEPEKLSANVNIGRARYNAFVAGCSARAS